jgi:EAL domain-containing protein (putative c-di-GMP-specific phosphodiesterase class I)
LSITPIKTAGRRVDDHEGDRTLLDDLVGAGERGEFSLVYQKQMAADGTRVIAVESLLRWEHPVLGAVDPGHFIPLAEQAGLIRPITRWVLGRAMEETKDLKGVSVCFNASALEFADPEFADEIEALVETRGFDPTCLEIEVTETAILVDGEEVHRTMARLHALGARIALDDFGAGYSSLNHLRLYPFDKLKIDRAFVTECSKATQSAALIHAVVGLGRALGMDVVAEGVETQTQAAFLRLAGVCGMQGYLFGHPKPIEEIRAELG